jgi:hypothetical protein
MNESYRKGVASHAGPESRVASREAAIKALTGGRPAGSDPEAPKARHLVIGDPHDLHAKKRWQAETAD